MSVVSCVCLRICASRSIARSVMCFFKQKTAYEMRISDWSSDVCSSDLVLVWVQNSHPAPVPAGSVGLNLMGDDDIAWLLQDIPPFGTRALDAGALLPEARWPQQIEVQAGKHRSEEHTSELQSLMRISYAVFCLKKKKK